MAIKHRKDGENLILEIDNGDLEKLDQCMKMWSFKDYQSMMRFAMSVFLVTEDKSLWIKSDKHQQPIAPAKELLKEETGE